MRNGAPNVGVFIFVFFRDHIRKSLLGAHIKTPGGGARVASKNKRITRYFFQFYFALP